MRPPTERPPVDLRLVPAAAAAWAVMLLGLGAGPVAGALVACVAAVLACLRRRSPVLLAAAGTAAAAGIVIASHTFLVASHPLHDQALRGAAATLRVLLRDDPRTLRTSGQPGPAAARVVVPAELVATTAGAGSWHGGGRVLLLAPAEGWQRLLPGQRVTAEGLLAPAERSDLTIAVLRVRGAPRDVDAPPWWQSAAGGLRSGLRAATGTLPPAEAGLLPGLAIGDTSALTQEVDDDFRAAGLTHLLAVSGDTAPQTGALGCLTTVGIPRAAGPSVVQG